MTDRGTNTLAARGLEELFPSCAVMSVFGSGGEIGFGLHTYVLKSTIQLWYCVSFFGSGGK